MNRGETLASMPNDLIPEILSRLPAKSIGRFRCVSKQWGSILSRQDFTELFFTRSSARPRLLLVLQRSNGELLFFSALQPQNPYEKSLVVTADYHMKLPGQMCGYNICSLASGLIYVPDFITSEDVNKKSKRSGGVGVICNPIMGQCVRLPVQGNLRKSTSFLGFDPIDKQFKVVGEVSPSFHGNHRILTLGTGKLSWRNNNHCPPYYCFSCQGINISGVFYYLAGNSTNFSDLLVCFDVKSEKFKVIEAECFRDYPATRLINFKGKLGGINFTYDADNAVVLSISFLEDVEKKEWSKYVYTFPMHEVRVRNVSVVGMTARGEIVLVEKFTSKPFCVFFFNPEKNTFQTVEIQGVGVNGEAFETDYRVFTFVDHVEDIGVKIQVQHHSEKDEDEYGDQDEYGYPLYPHGDGNGYGYENGYGNGNGYLLYPYGYGYGYPYEYYGYPYEYWYPYGYWYRYGYQ
ncbi:putative F-box protein At1g30925 [Capsella rubella]|uniref:putative F-box protein At1g30925 n=1 Tax=Capsella rubella TaxID=81985 RepID=UPI000CD547F0|nr:putative F-box protein At1g30925 [Capsella rubella]